MSPRGQTEPKERRNSIDTCSHGTGKEVSPQGDLYSRQLQAVPYVRPGDAVIDMSGYGGRSERLDSHVTGTLPAGLALWNGVSTTRTTKALAQQQWACSNTCSAYFPNSTCGRPSKCQAVPATSAAQTTDQRTFEIAAPPCSPG